MQKLHDTGYNAQILLLEEKKNTINKKKTFHSSFKKLPPTELKFKFRTQRDPTPHRTNEHIRHKNRVMSRKVHCATRQCANGRTHTSTRPEQHAHI